MKYLLALFILAFSLVSCHKDLIDETTTTEVSDPEILDNRFVTGKVVDPQGNAISEVTIEVIQEGMVIGTIESENDGTYSTEGVVINSQIPVLLQYAKPDFRNKFREFDLATAVSVEKNITLAGDEKNAEFEEGVLSTPIDSGLVKIYGYALYADGTPASGVQCMSVWEFEQLGGVYIFRKSALDVTDQDGYWEMYVAPEMVINFRAIHGIGFIGFLGTPCFLNFTPDLPLSQAPLSNFSTPFVELGSFSEETEVFLNEDNQLEYKRTMVSGKAKRCDGSPIQAGNLIVEMGSKIFTLILPTTRIEIKNYPFGPNGEFELNIESCDNGSISDWGVSVSAVDTLINWDGKATFEYEEIIDAGDVSLCYDQNYYPGQFEFILDQDTIMVTENFTDLPFSGEGSLFTEAILTDGDFQTSIYISLFNLMEGQNNLTRLEMREAKWNNGFWEVTNTPFNESPAMDAFAHITEIDGNWVSGYLEGQVMTTSGQKNISGNFKVYNK